MAECPKWKGSREMSQINLEESKILLEEFIKDYRTYIASYTIAGYGSKEKHYGYPNLRTKMQRHSGLVSNIVDFVRGDCSFKLSDTDSLNFYQALMYVLTNNISEQTRKFLESNVEATLNEAIGNIENGTIPSIETKRVIPINDDVLKNRCLDLLNSPGNFDRVINQATQVLETRIRSKLPFEKLCEIIPESKNQIGENLVHKLLGPPNPAIVVSEKKDECLAFYKMVVGVVAYLRNPSHHSLNDDTDWTLAWSVIGIVDSLLSEIEGSYVAGEEPKIAK